MFESDLDVEHALRAEIIVPGCVFWKTFDPEGLDYLPEVTVHEIAAYDPSKEFVVFFLSYNFRYRHSMTNETYKLWTL